MKRFVIAGVLLAGVLALSGFAMHGRGEFHKNPAKVVISLLDYKLDLSDSQEKDLKGILEPFFTDLRAEHKKLLDKPEELIAKIRDGKLEKADIVQKMEQRRALAAANQDKIAEVILKVYQILNEAQRGKAAELIKDRLDKVMK